MVNGLWDSWEDDALLYDKDSGLHFDSGKLHALEHRGAHFRARPAHVGAAAAGPSGGGAGRLVRSRPGTGRAHRRGHLHRAAVAGGRPAFYSGLKARWRYGRTPDQLKILPGVFPVVGRSEAEAQEKFEALQALIHPSVGGAAIAEPGGVDLSGYPLDGPLPDDLPEPNGAKSRFQLVTGLARRESLTIRQLYLRVATARGHWSIHGTPASIADQLRARFEGGAADGFNIMPPWLPGGLDDFIDRCCRNCAGAGCSARVRGPHPARAPGTGAAGASGGAAAGRRLKPPGREMGSGQTRASKGKQGQARARGQASKGNRTARGRLARCSVLVGFRQRRRRDTQAAQAVRTRAPSR